MKRLALTLAVSSSLLLFGISPTLWADTPNPVANLHQVVAFDANRDNKIDFNGVHNGSDTFIAREITNNDIANVKNTFVGRDGKTYVAVTFDELRSLNKNKDNVLTAEELKAAKSPLLTARMLQESDQIIIERPLEMSIKSITLPAAGKLVGAGLAWDGNQILIQQVNW